jgi:Lrp/AsnC family leucine-responsive transcriptional regulator
MNTDYRIKTRLSLGRSFINGDGNLKKIDETDNKILEILKKNGRASYSEIAQQVHLSRVAVKKRINQMIENGIISGFTVQISSKALCKPVSLFMDIEVEPKHVQKVAENLVELEDVAIVSQHTGMSGIHVHAYIDKIENISTFIEEKIHCIEGVKNVHTYILIKNYKTNAWLC